MILDRLREQVLRTSVVDGSGVIRSHRARYPSAEWNVRSWSHRLVRDLLLKRALHRSPLRGLPLRMVDRRTDSVFSYHQDAAYKGLLFTALRAAGSRDRVVLLPEVGPFGFDLLIARCAGFTRFVAYDLDARILEVCRSVHVGADVEYVVSSSADFDLDRYKSRDHLVIFPDWPHDALERRLAGFENVLRYSDRAGGLGLARMKERLGVQQIDWRGLFDEMQRLG